MDLVFGFFLALLLSTVLVPVFVRYAPALHLVDLPSEDRKVHTVPIPRSGGIPIVIGASASVLIWLGLEPEFYGFFLAALVIIVFGILDDTSELGHRFKFLGQILAVLVFIVSGNLIERVPFFGLDEVSGWISYPLTFFFLLGVTNAVNLSDGLDGLAAGNSLLSFGLIALLAISVDVPSVAVISLAVVGGLIGFLRFNTHPATVFMGDTGSQFLGFCCGGLAIFLTQHQNSALSPILPLVILGLPILDTLAVMLVRSYQRRSLFVADRSHLHHQFLKLGLRHYEVVAVLYAMQAILVFIAFILRYNDDLVIFSAYAVFCSLVLGTVVVGRKRCWHLHSEEDVYDGGDRRNPLVRKINWYHYSSTKIIQWLLGIFLVVSSIFVSQASTDIGVFSLVALACAPVLVALFWKHPEWLNRILFYAASAIVVNGFLLSTADQPLHNGIADVFVGVMVFLVLLAIRMTRKEVFRPDNKDFLVLVLVLCVPFFPIGEIDEFSFSRAVIRLAILLYACEFTLVGGVRHKHGVLSISSILSLVIVSIQNT